MLMKRRNESPLIFVLKGFIPYTNANLLLTYKPNAFFNELEKLSGYKRKTLQAAYYRARQQKLLTTDSVPRLTLEGKQRVQPFVAEYLGGNAKLMVIFDISEAQKSQRDKFRRFLQSLYFVQAQQSVWVTEYDHRDILREAIIAFDLSDSVQVYEAALIS